jgi:hypothetical protein
LHIGGQNEAEGENSKYFSRVKFDVSKAGKPNMKPVLAYSNAK